MSEKTEHQPDGTKACVVCLGCAFSYAAEHSETPQGGMDYCPVCNEAKADAELKTLRSELDQVRKERDEAREELREAEIFMDALESGALDCSVCGTAPTNNGTCRACMTGTSRFVLMQRALGQIKTLVCGDRHPRWGSEWATTSARGTIADLCDIALSSLPVPSGRKEGE